MKILCVLVFILCVTAIATGEEIASYNFDSGTATGFSLPPHCSTPVVAGGANSSSHTWHTSVWVAESDQQSYPGYYDACFGDRSFSPTLSGGDELWLTYYLKFSANWVFPPQTSGLKSILIGGYEWAAPFDVMLTKWAPVDGKTKPYFDIYGDPGASSNGGIPLRENPLSTGGTQAWVDFGWEVDTWYKIEIYVQLNTGTSENGIARYYVDGALLIEDTGVRFGSSPSWYHIMITNYVSGSTGWEPDGTNIYTDEIVLSTERLEGDPSISAPSGLRVVGGFSWQ